MKSTIYKTKSPKDYDGIPWQQADLRLRTRIKFHVAVRVLPLLFISIFCGLIVIGFCALLIWIAFIASKNADLTTKIFVAVFCLALSGLLLGGLIYMLRSEKKMTGLGVGQLFAKNIEFASGICKESYVKEMKVLIKRETAKYSDFQIGSYKVTRSFAEYVPIGTEYIFVKPKNRSAEIIYFPLSRKHLANTDLYDDSPKPKKIRSTYITGTIDDYKDIAWTRANEKTTEHIYMLMKKKVVPETILRSVIIFFCIALPFITIFTFVSETILETSSWNQPLFQTLLVIVVAILISMPIRTVMMIKRMRTDEIYTANGSCVEYFMRGGKRSYFYYAIFTVGRVSVMLELSEKDYEKLKLGTEYVFIKPKRPNSRWFGFAKE